MSNWTQPVCDPCWAAEYGVFDTDGHLIGLSREPARRVDPDELVCCRCGRPTRSGILVRVDPTTVPFPRAD